MVHTGSVTRKQFLLVNRAGWGVGVSVTATCYGTMAVLVLYITDFVLIFIIDTNFKHDYDSMNCLFVIVIF